MGGAWLTFFANPGTVNPCIPAFLNVSCNAFPVKIFTILCENSSSSITSPLFPANYAFKIFVLRLLYTIYCYRERKSKPYLRTCSFISKHISSLYPQSPLHTLVYCSFLLFFLILPADSISFYARLSFYQLYKHAKKHQPTK